jgi:hypothetical protein
MADTQEYSARIAAQIKQLEDPEILHKLPDIYGYWAGKFITHRMIETLEVAEVADFYAKYFVESTYGDAEGKFFSVGSGDSANEIAVALALIGQGYSRFHIKCLELSPHLAERARGSIYENKLQDHLSVVECDLNFWTADQPYHAAMAQHSLHHIVNLENLFSQIRSALYPRGFFLTMDMIGRNGHMRWPETLGVVEEIWRHLPLRYKYSHQSQCFHPDFVNFDCSVEGFEGIRSQDILPLLTTKFNFSRFLVFGGIIDVFIDRGYGPNFDRQNPFDHAIIDSIQSLEDELTDAGYIKPTMMIAVMTPVPVVYPIVYRGRTPEASCRPPGASLPVPRITWRLPDPSLHRGSTGFDPTQHTTLDFSDPSLTQRLRLSGWCRPEPENGGCWTEGPRASLLISLSQVAPPVFELAFDIIPYLPPDGPQEIDVSVNGEHFGRWTFPEEEPNQLAHHALVLRSFGGSPVMDLIVEFLITRPRVPGENNSPDGRALGLFISRVHIGPL